MAVSTTSFMSWGGPTTRPRAAQGISWAQASWGCFLSLPNKHLGSGTHGGEATGYKPRSIGLGVLAARQARAGQSESAVQQGSWLQSTQSIPIIELS